jgi:hypothetical protein
MIRGCLTLSGLGLLSLFVFGVTLEALNDPKELSDIPFKPWDFFTYGLIALGALLQPAIHSRLVDEWQRPIQSSKINAKVEDPIVLVLWVSAANGELVAYSRGPRQSLPQRNRPKEDSR